MKKKLMYMFMAISCLNGIVFSASGGDSSTTSSSEPLILPEMPSEFGGITPISPTEPIFTTDIASEFAAFIYGLIDKDPAYAEWKDPNNFNFEKFKEFMQNNFLNKIEEYSINFNLEPDELDQFLESVPARVLWLLKHQINPEVAYMALLEQYHHNFGDVVNDQFSNLLETTFKEYVNLFVSTFPDATFAQFAAVAGPYVAAILKMNNINEYYVTYFVMTSWQNHMENMEK